MSEIVNLPLRKIIRDPRCQPRVNPLDNDHVEEMREAKANGSVFPPVVVYHEVHSPTRSDYYLSEGFHRFEVFDLDCDDTIPCIVRGGTLEDAIVNAMASNAAHGLKRTKGDARRAIERMFRLRPDWSDRRIAEHVQVSNGWVSEIHRDLDRAEQECAVPHSGSTQHTEPPKATVREGRDGVKRTHTVKSEPVAPPTVAEVLERADRAAEGQPEAQKESFDWKEWRRSFGSLVRLLGTAAKAGDCHNGKEHRACLDSFEAMTKFVVLSLSKGK